MGNYGFFTNSPLVGGRVVVRAAILAAGGGRRQVSIPSVAALFVSFPLLLYFALTSHLPALLSLYPFSLGDDTMSPTGVDDLLNPSLAEHDTPCLSKQCRSRSVGF